MKEKDLLLDTGLIDRKNVPNKQSRPCKFFYYPLILVFLIVLSNLLQCDSRPKERENITPRELIVDQRNELENIKETEKKVDENTTEKASIQIARAEREILEQIRRDDQADTPEEINIQGEISTITGDIKEKENDAEDFEMEKELSKQEAVRDFLLSADQIYRAIQEGIESCQVVSDTYKTLMDKEDEDGYLTSSFVESEMEDNDWDRHIKEIPQQMKEIRELIKSLPRVPNKCSQCEKANNTLKSYYKLYDDYAYLARRVTNYSKSYVRRKLDDYESRNERISEKLDELLELY